jgi:hypothetical protein
MNQENTATRTFTNAFAGRRMRMKAITRGLIAFSLAAAVAAQEGKVTIVMSGHRNWLECPAKRRPC